MKLIYLAYYLIILSIVGTDIPLTCESIQIKQIDSDIYIRRCSILRDGTPIFELGNYTTKSESTELWEEIDILTFGESVFYIPKDLVKYSTSFTLNDNSFDLIISDTIFLTVGKVLNPAIFKFRCGTREKDQTTEYVSLAYWRKENGKFRRTDHALSIEIDKKTKVVTKIRDYPIP